MTTIKKRHPFSSLKKTFNPIELKPITINEKIIYNYNNELIEKIKIIKHSKKTRGSSINNYSIITTFPEEIFIFKNNLLTLHDYFNHEIKSKCLSSYTFLLYNLLKKEERVILNNSSAILTESLIISYKEPGNYEELKTNIISLIERVISFSNCFVKYIKIKHAKNTTVFLKNRQTNSKQRISILNNPYSKLINIYTPIFILINKLMDL